MHIVSSQLLTSWPLNSSFASWGRQKEKAKMASANWLAPLRFLKCLEGEKVETIDLLDALSIIFI